MQTLARNDLYSLEQYASERNEFRAKVMAHKKNRYIDVGNHVVLFFEDRLTIQYQVQEMLRAEKIFEASGIQEELDAYNPLIPDGNNWKVTFMIQYDDPDERKVELAKLIGIEKKTWVQVAGFDKVYAIADEDLERENEEKTSSVHFLRFELQPEMIAAVKSGAEVNVGIDHEHYRKQVSPIPTVIRDAIAKDLL